MNHQQTTNYKPDNGEGTKNSKIQTSNLDCRLHVHTAVCSDVLMVLAMVDSQNERMPRYVIKSDSKTSASM